MYEPDKVASMVDELGEKFAHRMWQLKVMPHLVLCVLLEV